MNSVSILSWWWLCRVFGGALWPLLLPWPIDFPNKAEGARTRAPIVHFNPCNFFHSRRRNNWSRPKSGGGESHMGLNHFQVGRDGEGGSHILQEASRLRNWFSLVVYIVCAGDFRTKVWEIFFTWGAGPVVHQTVNIFFYVILRKRLFIPRAFDWNVSPLELHNK